MLFLVFHNRVYIRQCFPMHAYCFHIQFLVDLTSGHQFSCWDIWFLQSKESALNIADLWYSFCSCSGSIPHMLCSFGFCEVLKWCAHENPKSTPTVTSASGKQHTRQAKSTITGVRIYWPLKLFQRINIETSVFARLFVKMLKLVSSRRFEMLFQKPSILIAKFTSIADSSDFNSQCKVALNNVTSLSNTYTYIKHV